MRAVLLAALGAVVVFGATAVVFLPALSGSDENLDAAFAIVLFGGLGFHWALGAVIVVRARGHIIGWMFAVAAAMLASVFGCWAASGVAATADPGGTTQAWFILAGSILFPPALILAIPAVTIVFPTGTLPGPRWRLPVALLAGSVAAQTIAMFLLPGPVDGDVMNPMSAWTAHLPAVLIDLLRVVAAVGSLAIPYALALAVAAVIVRFRRSLGDERAQLKWLLAAAIPAAILIPLSLSDIGATIPGIDAISALSLPLAALAVAIAILRYRLFDIDRIISRTIAYALITGFLVATYAALILLLQGPLDQLTGGGTVSVALSTLIVAALFQPIRQLVQRAVDHRFDRARYDGERTAASFAASLRDEIDLDALAGELERTVTGAMRPTSASVWLFERGAR